MPKSQFAICCRLWERMGTNDPYVTLRELNPDLASRMEEVYTAEYEAAPERTDENVNPFDVVFQPDYVRSKSQIIDAWAAEIEKAVVEAYVRQFKPGDLEAAMDLLRLNGRIDIDVTICEGIALYWRRLKSSKE